MNAATVIQTGLFDEIPEPEADSDAMPSRFRSPICREGYRKGIPNPAKGKTFPAEILTREEIFRLRDACNKGASGRRNWAQIVTLWRAGLRVGESCALRPIDIDYDAGTIRVLRGKTANSNRTVGIDPDALEVLHEWSLIRADLGVHRLSPFFCTIQRDHLGHPLGTANVRNMLRHLADKAGIEKRVHPHCLRHCHAAELAQEGVDIRVIAAQLGHSNIAITHRYVSHLWPGEAVQAMRGRAWQS